MARLTSKERRKIEALTHRLRQLDLPWTQELDPVMPEVQELVGFDVAHTYRVTSDEECLRLEGVRYVGLAGGDDTARLLERDTRFDRGGWGMFDPFRPEPAQRNALVVMAWRDWQHPDPTMVARGLRPRLSTLGIDRSSATRVAERLDVARRLLHRIGLGHLDQLRCLVCEGESLLAWVGGFHAEPIDESMRLRFRAVLPALRERLVVARNLREADLMRSALGAALEEIPAPAFLAASTGAVRHANAAGRALLTRDKASTLESLGYSVRGRCPSGTTCSRVAAPGLPPLFLVVQRDIEDPAAARALRAAEQWELTARQTDVLVHLARACSNKEIAARLQCAERTVEVHVSAILQRSGCDSRAAVIAVLASLAPR